MRIVGNPPSGGKKPTTPTIGTATDGGTGTTVSVAFTPSTYIGKSTITYTATSSPGSITGTGSGSPITVSGLTTGTAYTFTVLGNTNYGVASDSSAASNSVTPASPSSYESIATITATGSQSTITFSSIPSTYKHLQFRIIAKDGVGYNTIIRFNNDSSTNYASHNLYGNATSAGAQGVNTATVISYGFNTGGTEFNPAIIDIIDYASTVKNKTMRCFSGRENNSAGQIRLSSGLWQGTAAINRIDFINDGATNYASGSIFALYGIKG